MVHFGIICPPFFSHLHCFAALGRELQSRGHRVTFLQIPDVEFTIRSEGLEFYSIGLDSYVSGSLAATIEQLGQFSGVAALRYSAQFCQHITAIVCQDAPRAIETIGIDVLLVDQLEPAGESVAEGVGLPFIGVCCGQLIRREAAIPPYFTGWHYQTALWAKLRNQVAYAILDHESRSMLQVLNTYRKQWNLPLYRSLYTLQPSRLRLAQIIQQPLEFDFPWTHLPQNWHFVGPLRSVSQGEISGSLAKLIAFPYDQLTGQPLVYASLGTLQHTNRQLFHTIAAACVGLDLQLVITLGGGMAAETMVDLPGSPLVVKSAPQLEVLSRASLTITHGGLNTILDSLSQGVPLVAIPITYEQPGNGARIERTGTGKVVPLKQLTVDRLQTTIQQVLTQECYTKKAQQLQQAIVQAGGVQRAANLIDQAISFLQPGVVPVR